MRRLGASITLYVSLSLLICMSLLFSFIELARVEGMAGRATLSSLRAKESAFAQYNRLLWQEYGVMFFDGGYGMADFAIENLEYQLEKYGGSSENRDDIIALAVSGVMVPEYSLATDNGGRDFLDQACDKIWLVRGASLISDSSDELEKAKGLKEDGDGTENKVSGSFTKLAAGEAKRQKMIEAEKKKAEEEDRSPNLAKYQDSADIKAFKKTAKEVKSAKKSGGMTAFVLGGAAVSTKSINESETLSSRTLNVGTGTGAKTSTTFSSAYKEALFSEYLKEYFSCYTDVKDNRGLDYEMEYILSGKATDAKNLEAAIDKLLLLRQAENLAALKLNTKLDGEAEALAEAISAAVFLPEIAPAVQIIVEVTWAFVESVMDVRTLLAGGKISLIKSGSEWTSNLLSLATILDSSYKAKDCASGITYQGYLNQLIYLESTKTKTYRAMDAMEASLRLDSLTPNAKMDNMIGRVTGKMEFQGTPLFGSFITMADYGGKVYSYVRDVEFSYY